MFRGLKIVVRWTFLMLCYGFIPAAAADLAVCGQQEDCRKFSYHGKNFVFYDKEISIKTIDIITSEIVSGEYPLSKYSLKTNDVIIDVGAHVGVISIVLALLNPHATIYAFEACPVNFHFLKKNIAANKVNNVKAFNLAVTDKTGKMVTVYDHGGGGNSGASTIFAMHPSSSSYIKEYQVSSISLDDIFKRYGIKKCQLLKIDCEGSEYDVLYNSINFKQSKVENITGEFHSNPYLRKQGYSLKHLLHFTNKHVAGRKDLICYNAP